VVACLLPCRYGPFWICTTLIFVTAVTGNYASYMDFRQQVSNRTGSTLLRRDRHVQGMQVARGMVFTGMAEP
jgi:hypothetical protein